ncbi:MAG: hypothetical protein WD048_13200 [Chitinophagales bacterium]
MIIETSKKIPMKSKPENIDKILPFGEFIRGFANQSYVSKSDLNKFLKSRGVFSRLYDKENLVPTLCTVLISASEFDELRQYQHTKEDNIKKSTSRIDCEPDLELFQEIRDLNLDDLISEEQLNYSLITPPKISFDNNKPNKVSISFEIERFDLNKSWYESSNKFSGQIDLEKTEENQLLIIKSYTSSESDNVANAIQKKAILYLKDKNKIKADKDLVKVLFGNFSNENRLLFFYRLSSQMNSDVFDFVDIENIEISPDHNTELPEEIDWMKKKTELKLKGKEIHQTFFVKERKFQKHLKFWEVESAFKYSYLNYKGKCNVTFSFKDFPKKGDDAEFEINISSFRLNDSSTYSANEKNKLKRTLLDLFNKQKEKTFTDFLEYLKEKESLA